MSERLAVPQLSTAPAASHRDDTAFSVRSQAAVVWWSLAFGAIFFVAFVWLLNMFPPPDADMSAEEVAQWYRDQDTQIKIGATIASFTAAFLLPFWAVIAVQMSRQERGRPIWSVLAVAGGALSTVVLALPPVFWGVAAFTPDRDPEITQLMHELGCLTLVTTTQFYIYNWVALVVICFRPQIAEHSPFPRWFGYFTAWMAMIFEGGAIAYLAKSGPFSWNGLVPLWLPFCSFGVWMAVTSWLLLTRLKSQHFDAEARERGPTPMQPCDVELHGAASPR